VLRGFATNRNPARAEASIGRVKAEERPPSVGSLAAMDCSGCRHRSDACGGSAVKLVGDQKAISLVDLLETLLGRRVTTVQIGVVALDQGLVASLELLQREPDLQTQDRHHLSGLAERGSSAATLRLALAVPGTAAAEEAERVMKAVGVVADRCTETPARPVPGRVRSPMRLDLVLVHAGEVVPALVVLADMSQAVPDEPPQILRRLGRRIGAVCRAARPFAARAVWPGCGAQADLGIRPELAPRFASCFHSPLCNVMQWCRAAKLGGIDAERLWAFEREATRSSCGRVSCQLLARPAPGASMSKRPVGRPAHRIERHAERRWQHELGGHIVMTRGP